MRNEQNVIQIGSGVNSSLVYRCVTWRTLYSLGYFGGGEISPTRILTKNTTGVKKSRRRCQCQRHDVGLDRTVALN